MERTAWRTLVMSIALAGCSDSVEPVADAATDAAGCARACDDGVFCNGAERCAPGESGSDADGCLAGESPCDGMCNEDADRCEICGDADGDGSLDARCGGADCDDGDPQRFPGAIEVCDTADLDEDCNPETYGVRDADGDTYADGACCNGDACGPDCDDASAGVHPASPETCDGRDNDCDDATDESVVPTFYVDADGDGHGDATAGAATMMICLSPGAGWSPTNDDCDDAADDVHPGLPELCNRRDDNCRDGADEGIDCPCFIGDPPLACGSDLGECRIGSRACIGGMLGPCEGGVFSATETCSPASVGMGSATDEDCDGAVDEALTASCYTDGDRDGYGAGAAAPRCAGAGGGCPEGFAASSGDCLDGDTRARPGLAETCDEVDNDCNGLVDDGRHVERTYVTAGLCEVWEYNRTRACDGEVAGDCRTTAGPGECAHQTGFATYIGGAIDAVCVAADMRPTTIAELATHHPGCDGTDAGYPACRAASHRLCVSLGYVGGFGYERGTVHEVACFTSAQAEIRYASWADLDARDGAAEAYCAGFPADGWWCNRAADRFCIDAGFHAGFGPVEQNASAATLLCLRDY